MNSATAPNLVYLGLGGNLGNRKANLRNAIEEITAVSDQTTVIAESSIYETAPVGYLEQPDFLNMVIAIRTDLAAISLLIKLQEIEHKMGRVREFKDGPRPIDIDILFFNDEVISQPHLKVPHPRLHQRQFVLEPLAEIAEELYHPGLKKTIAELFTELKQATKTK